MDYASVMYLANFIKNEVDDREDKLTHIYEKAVRESDSYKELEALRQRVVFFDNGTGRTLFDECNALMRDVLSEPENGREILVRMQNLSKDIRAEETRSLRVMEGFFENLTSDKIRNASSDGFRTEDSDKLDNVDSVGVLAKEVNEEYGRVINALAASIVFTLLVTGGTKDINGLRWNDNNSLNVKLNIINNEMIPRLYDGNTDVRLWRIVRTGDDMSIRFCDFRYSLEYISYDDYNMYVRQMKRLADNLYVDEHLSGSDNCGTVYAGLGRIVPCNAVSCIGRLSEGILVRDDYFGAVSQELASLRSDLLVTDLLEDMSEGKMYVVSPSKACDLLNQYANAKEIYNRKKSGQCLICKKMITSGLVCKGHFNTHDRVYY